MATPTIVTAAVVRKKVLKPHESIINPPITEVANPDKPIEIILALDMLDCHLGVTLDMEMMVMAGRASECLP